MDVEGERKSKGREKAQVLFQVSFASCPAASPFTHKLLYSFIHSLIEICKKRSFKEGWSLCYK